MRQVRCNNIGNFVAPFSQKDRLQQGIYVKMSAILSKNRFGIFFVAFEVYFDKQIEKKGE